MKNFIEEFKAFALRGNVMDMAIGVIIGGAFQAIIKSFIENIINPLVGVIFQVDFSNVVISLGSVNLMIGAFISSVINFFLLAFVLFVMVKAINKLKKPEVKEEAAPVKSDETVLLEKILEQLKNK
ncbi:MAG: large conductance mechanosensitive channel protein MscL [Solobacterium sp.]|jgi:large conductance mechanosensitive channel protein|uniref:large conductance mechanosensitive channel protein MscL n=1 Tax=Solobacterium sp. TaxID=2060878 RepID=UPI001CB434CF|nr:large conductance mechanosensitive channel protein MscL [Solobacterium sp.]MBF1072532.1 large conductance mechanosensitive channel protein MscL [Solobacterium sp.]MBF1089609.1 large conductance mechanosensitive channel protein MscL [Solobacterium sp.]MBF1090573.1 large conductance mechanosensitive channel protein MscL [Solobacterium sp.]MBF1091662.1 large conductance mechanosensitive channel protein MscL [Solobacterium sp.]MBF1095578.1 large conductance mechanosensitive channel protein MscL